MTGNVDCEDIWREVYELLLKKLRSLHAAAGIHWKFYLGSDPVGSDSVTRTVTLHSFWRDKSRTSPGDGRDALANFCHMSDILELRIRLWCDVPKLFALYTDQGFHEIERREDTVYFVREPVPVREHDCPVRTFH